MKPDISEFLFIRKTPKISEINSRISTVFNGLRAGYFYPSIA